MTVQRQIVDQLYDRMSASVVAGSLASLAFAVAIWQPERTVAVVAWLVVELSTGVLSSISQRIYRRGGFPSDEVALQTRRLLAWASALVWVAAYPLLLDAAVGMDTFVLFTCYLGLSAGAAVTYGIDPWIVGLVAGTFALPVMWMALQVAPALVVLPPAYVMLLLEQSRRTSRLMHQVLTLQEDNQRLLTAAVQGRERAEQAAADRTRFLAAASHDLRQPVQAMSLFAHALSAPDLPSKERGRLVALLSGAAEMLSTMLHRLLDLSRVDSGLLELSPEAVDTRALLSEVAQGLSAEAADCGGIVQVRGRQASVWADPTALRRILHNLASNALRHGRAGGMVILATRVRPTGCEFQVWDDGPGIAEADHEPIFQEFVRLSRGEPGRPAGEGLGLGLPMVKRLCAQSGFRLALRSKPGHGSVFSVFVPCVREGQGTVGRGQANARSEALGLRVLLAEDHGALRAALCASLEGLGCHVSAHADGEAALAVLRGGQEDGLDVVLTDQRLPGALQGTDLVSAVREHLRRPLPAIVLTGEADDPALRERLARDPNGQLLRKPVSGETLVAALRRGVALQQQK